MCRKCRSAEQLTKALGTDFFLDGICEKCEAYERSRMPKLKPSQRRANRMRKAELVEKKGDGG